jgi:organic radical activating enzyme
MSMPSTNLITDIIWHLNDHCKSECSYCPISLQGAAEIPETPDYLRVARLLIDSYNQMGRSIKWTFNGGEPLDMNDIVTLLKLCRENSQSMTLHTNGGRLWVDWWAIEPYVDNLKLTYHYWQNPALIKYIIDTFRNKNKSFTVLVPIRPNFFDQDIERALDIERQHGIVVGKTVLYKDARGDSTMFPYTKEQLAIMSGAKIVKETPDKIKKEAIKTASLVKEKEYVDSTTWDERYKKTYNSNPSYAGQLCNVGIERLNISHQGWVSGSDCNNQPLGNIWHENWQPPNAPQQCTMIACISKSDQQITKFPLPV